MQAVSLGIDRDASQRFQLRQQLRQLCVGGDHRKPRSKTPRFALRRLEIPDQLLHRLDRRERGHRFPQNFHALPFLGMIEQSSRRVADCCTWIAG